MVCWLRISITTMYEEFDKVLAEMYAALEDAGIYAVEEENYQIYCDVNA